MLFPYKKNAINGKLFGANKIASNFQLEATRIKTKFLKDCFPYEVIEVTINNFSNVDGGTYHTKTDF